MTGTGRPAAKHLRRTAVAMLPVLVLLGLGAMAPAHADWNRGSNTRTQQSWRHEDGRQDRWRRQGGYAWNYDRPWNHLYDGFGVPERPSPFYRSPPVYVRPPTYYVPPPAICYPGTC